MNAKLVDYILDAKTKSFADEQIREMLRIHGWFDSDIDEALEEADAISEIEKKSRRLFGFLARKKPVAPPQAPEKRDGIPPETV
jgi:hypothetical protein